MKHYFLTIQEKLYREDAVDKFISDFAGQPDDWTRESDGISFRFDSAKDRIEFMLFTMKMELQTVDA